MLDLFKAAAAVSRRSDTVAYPDDRLGFTLEYARPPDLDVERARLVALLGAGGFDLLPYSEDDPVLAILLFASVPIEQPADYLFHEAEELRAALDLVSVTPETGPLYVDAVTIRGAPESVGAIASAFCLSDAVSSADPRWAVELIRADEAWAAHGVSGAGIRIGQPDTGVADHRELDGAVDQDAGYDFVGGKPDPTDPLSPDMRSPGHGTATASVVASRTGQGLSGSAPGATVVPIRAVNSVVIGSGVAVARAVDHARHAGCRVVTMSLGGPIAGRALRRAIARAVAADMIVLAAAGNCIRIVAYPAWDTNVIAVAAVDRGGLVWRGSCRGPAVDVSAPGENVHVARRSGDDPALDIVDDRGQGTSYAAAITAGVAALWLERFGTAQVEAEARSRAVTVQALFRSALRHTARAPAGWDSGAMGTGIVDAQALLDLPLADIPAPPAVTGDNPILSILGSDLAEGPFGAEASFVAADWQMRRHAGGRVIETAMPALPSPGLASLIGKPPAETVLTAAPVVGRVAEPMALAPAMQRLSVSIGTGLESAGVEGATEALARVRQEGAQKLMKRAGDTLRKRAERAPGLTDTGVQTEALRRIEPVLGAIMSGDGLDGLDEDKATEARAVLEALVRMEGRPVLRIRRDGSEVFDDDIGDWRGDLLPTRKKWQALARLTGRIDVEIAGRGWMQAGTGFVIGENRIMTNRHVLDTFAVGLPASEGEQAFKMRRVASINFDPDGTDETMRFPITGIATAGKHRIGRAVHLGKLDMAILEIGQNAEGDDPPEPIGSDRISTTDEDVQKLLVMGYPAQPPGKNAGPDAQDDPEEFLAFWDRIGELYGDEYGVQYMSPGFVMKRPGTLAGDPAGWSFSHDATTMGGSSGSAIVALHGKARFCGLHFGGESLSQNFAHDIECVVAKADGTFRTGLLDGADD